MNDSLFDETLSDKALRFQNGLATKGVSYLHRNFLASPR
jgi:hypothetical protein